MLDLDGGYSTIDHFGAEDVFDGEVVLIAFILSYLILKLRLLQKVLNRFKVKVHIWFLVLGVASGQHIRLGLLLALRVRVDA